MIITIIGYKNIHILNSIFINKFSIICYNEISPKNMQKKQDLFLITLFFEFINYFSIKLFGILGSSIIKK